VTVDQLEHEYERAQVDAKEADNLNVDVTTQNVARLTLKGQSRLQAFVIDGQSFPMSVSATFEKSGGKWRVAGREHGPQKAHGLQGPIDDAFMDAFVCVKPDRAGQDPVNQFAMKQLDRFSREFPKYMRGDVPVKIVAQVTSDDSRNASIIAFGTPASNPLIARMVKNAPIHWTAKSITVGKQQFDSATHILSMIYPNPENPGRYMVLNSGHTFHEADFKGTNVLLYPRVGDWAVTEVSTGKIVAEGVFDRNWKLTQK
jgi:hypothetical protein